MRGSHHVRTIALIAALTVSIMLTVGCLSLLWGLDEVVTSIVLDCLAAGLFDLVGQWYRVVKARREEDRDDG